MAEEAPEGQGLRKFQLSSRQSWLLTLFFLRLAQNNKENKNGNTAVSQLSPESPLGGCAVKSSKRLREAWHSKGYHRTRILNQNGS